MSPLTEHRIVTGLDKVRSAQTEGNATKQLNDEVRKNTIVALGQRMYSDDEILERWCYGEASEPAR